MDHGPCRNFHLLLNWLGVGTVSNLDSFFWPDPYFGCSDSILPIFYSEDCPKNILLPYLPDIMNKLESVLKAKFNELVEKGNKVP